MRNGPDRVRKLRNNMKLHVTRWHSGKSQPGLSSMADNLRSWMKEAQSIREIGDVNTPEFQNAVNTLEDAWDERDNPQAIQAHVEDAVESLDVAVEEVETPEATLSEDVGDIKFSMKALYGDENVRENVEHYVLKDLFRIKRDLTGLINTRQINHNHRRHIKSLVDDLRQIGATYGSIKSANQYAIIAASSVSNAINQPRAFRQHIARAIKAIDELATTFNMQYSVKTKPALTGELAEANLANVQILQDMMFNHNFYTPAEFIPHALKSAINLRDQLSAYNDYKANRLARETVEHLREAYRNSKTNSVKSMPTNTGWQHNGVRQPFDYALNNIDYLFRHMNNAI